MKVGLISDTHGVLRPEVFEHFAGVEHILHAGDIGPADLLIELETIAPVTAVWGNTDKSDIRERVPEVARVTLDGVEAVVFHGHQLGSPNTEKAAKAYPEAGLVMFGHSHSPVIRRVGPVLAVNPGSAGWARFGSPVTLAIAEFRAGTVEAQLITLQPEKPR